MSANVFGPLTKAFGRIGLLSFGGPAAQIALMHRVIVEEKKWLDERTYLNALSFCMLLPGPEAMQLATYVGWKRAGILGGLLSGLLFVLPGAFVIAVLALSYSIFGTRPEAQAVLIGIQATVIMIVLQALYRLSKKSLRSTGLWAVALLSFCAIFLFDLPFPVILILAAIYGAMAQGTPPTTDADNPVSLPFSFRQTGFWLVLWLTPLAVLWAMDQTLLFQLGTFFAKLAVVTFGGAYAVLAYMAQEVVTIRGWLSPEQMVDALGLAETTPGPLILVTQFVGMVTGYEYAGVGFALIAGLLTLWMTFVPCFLWIFTFAPHLDHLLARPRLQGALSAISAAVVGVILNLSIWFALHVFFEDVQSHSFGIVSVTWPVLSSVSVPTLLLSALAGLALFWRHHSVLTTLVLTVVAGLGLYHFGVIG